MDEEPFAVVQFDDGFEIVMRAWGVFENNEMVATFFPPDVSKTELYKLLSQKSIEFDSDTWVNDCGEPFMIQKFCSYATTLENAEKKLRLFVLLSDVESDDAKNQEKLKSSRHSRCINNKDSPLKNCENYEYKKKKRDPKAGPSKNLPFAQNFSGTRQEKDNDENDEFPSQTEKRSKSTGSFPDRSVFENSPSRRKSTGSFPDDEVQFVDQNFEKQLLVESGRQLTGNQETVKEIDQNSPDDPTLNFVKKSTKMLFSKMNKLQMQLENNNNNPTQEHSQAKSVQSSSFFLPDNDFKMFPGKDILEIKEIEKKLGSNSFFLKISKGLIELGNARTDSITVANMLNHLVTFEAGQAFTYKGKSAIKPAFYDLMLHSLVIYAMKQLKTNLERSRIEKYIESWLTQCKTNEKRQRISKEKKRKAVEDSLIRFTDD